MSDAPETPLAIDSASTRPTAIEKAAVWRRWRASLVDSLVVSSASALLYALITETTPFWWDSLVNLAVIGFAGIYYIWPYSTSGQTLGKRLFGIRVVPIAGSALTWRSGLLRTVGYTISSFPFGFGYLWALWDVDGQTWHDKLAGTWVVRDWLGSEAGPWRLDPEKARRRQRRWLLGLGVPSVVLAACGAVAIFAFGLAATYPSVWPQLSEALGFDADYATLGAALSQRLDTDGTLPTASFGFDTNTGGVSSDETWLVIELSYTQRCNSTAADPCEALADELAQIVLANYSPVDELAGLRVIIGKRPHDLYVEAADIIYEKALTIAEWRTDLARGE